MEENPAPAILEGRITGISFSLATRQEICLSSISDCPISHASQLTNPFLGLPLEAGKCEACGTAEPGKCEGHFGYIELPVPIYHPSHISELKRILSLICLKCLKFKNRRLQTKNAGVLERAFAGCCEDAAQVSVNEARTTEGACYLELKFPSRSRPREGFWDFLDRYGYHYGGDALSRPLLSSEVLTILKKIPEATKKKLAGKGCFFQEGYIMQYLPVPPNCLSTPDVSDGMSVMSSDISMTMLKKVLRQVEIIKSSRSGVPNFESLEVEVNDLQAAVAQYLQSRGAKASPNRNTRYGIVKELNDSSSTKAWLEKMKTLFISKGSGFSSRSVITGDPYKGVGEIGIPFEIAQRITFEERVTEHNMKFLQKLVDDKLCLTYRDGQSTYSLREGSKGHTFLKPGQIVHRKIMEGDVIFINRPPTTHKHSLQALSVYIHDDHTFKINPLICGPLSADFDGDCIHIFYPQSPEAKAEVLELFAVEKQLLSSHSGNVNLQLGMDSLLSLKTLFKTFFFTKAQVQQLALFTSSSLPTPSMLKVRKSGPLWTVLELLETSLPRGFDCSGDKFLIRDSKFLKLDYSRDVIQSVVNDVISSIFFSKGPKEVLKLFNSLQPMLMENLCCEGFNLSLEDFIVPKSVLRSIEAEIQEVSSLLYHLRSNYNEVIAVQLEKHLRVVKGPISDFILRFSSMGNLIDSKSDSAVTRIVQQIGFLGLQILEKGRLYSRTLAEDLSSHFLGNYPFPDKYPSEEFGLVRSCLFYGLDPYQEMVHSIASREVMVRSSRGLTEPGTLFKNLMAILRDVVICYDGTVRNVCSNSIIQFEYGVKTQNLFAAGEPVGVLAATAMSNPAYKAVLDSSPNSNSSWNMMKEILLCGVNFKNVPTDRRVILYLNDCDCGEKYCLENAAYLVKNHLRKVSLKDVALEFLIEYKRQQTTYENAEIDAGLVGHVHLNKTQLKESNISMEEVLTKCEDTLNSFRKKKKIGQMFKKIALSCSECTFQQSSESKWTPCLKFFWQDAPDIHLEKTARIFADKICPVLLNAIIKGDPRVREASITWISPETTAWIRNPNKDTKGELAIDVVLEKDAVKKSGDAWRTVMDSCLPIIHLIDTRRSIPYAIKQVEDLLGISCAFEQAVQRLSTSVGMVSKGMLKEHLLLLANSMTCAGNLVGFNQAGIKALSKTLNFQVPFSEATLYTPKRCFEKAAEKCHSDSLSSIVAACSWGKPVAVGTGSRFDILWDTREVEMNQKDGIDVYNFLHLVRGGSEEEAESAGLAGEVDSFEMEDNFMEIGSPEHDTAATKPVFEDGLEMDLDEMDGKSSWGNGPEVGGDSGGWGAAVKTTAATEGGWGEAKSDKEQSAGGATKKDAEPAGAWGAKKDAEPAGAWGAKKDAEPAGAWGAKKDAEPAGAWGAKKDAEPLELGSEKRRRAIGAWGAKKDAEPSGAWGAKKEPSHLEHGERKKPPSRLEHGEPKKTPSHLELGEQNLKKMPSRPELGSERTRADGAWGAKKDAEPTGAWGAKKDAGPAGAWGAKKDAEPSGAWGAKKDAEPAGAWGAKPQKNAEPSGAWGAKPQKDAEPSGAWGAKAQKDAEPAGSWGAKAQKDAEPSGSWGAKAQKDVEPSGSWGKKDFGKAQGGSSSGSWGKPAQKSDAPSWNKGGELKVDVAGDSDPKWGAAVESDKGRDKSEGSDWGKKVEEKTEKTDSKDSWGAPWGKKETPKSSGWGAQAEQTANTAGTDAEASNGEEKAPEKPGSWGWNRKSEQKQDQGGWKKKEGWGPSGGGGDWKNKRDRPARPVGGPNDGPRTGGPFTATRQRLDMFTLEEQDILTDIEPIMQSIRRIMHQNGYNDGDPLSADDQTYILDNVFNHHPEKAQKMGAGVDYIMSGWKRDSGDEAGTPRGRTGWNRDSADEGGTPGSQSGGNREGNVAADEGGTQLNKESGMAAPKDGAAGGTGWGASSTAGGSGWGAGGTAAPTAPAGGLGWGAGGTAAPTAPAGGSDGELVARRTRCSGWELVARGTDGGWGRSWWFGMGSWWHGGTDGTGGWFWMGS
ncbi:hypothetical protein OSB04_001578 [Centaurea solstitialis]|uniref:DNA-directed RNA polymerase subunit n=1 Tax=Centaurea solstitialis TaxID=347529 RepID=A0AA38WLV9_9ASTR|nr:hypothetical protein OSB04_001578 [Centaurea solstitialis]